MLEQQCGADSCRDVIQSAKITDMPQDWIYYLLPTWVHTVSLLEQLAIIRH